MSVPLWRRSETFHRRAEILVVGAGICGIAAAQHIAARRRNVLVAESRFVGAGASGRNAGFLMRGIAENYALAADQHGRDLARTLWQWSEENLRILTEAGAGSLPSFRPTPSCLLAFDPAEKDLLSRSCEMLRDDGFDARWLERHDDPPWRAGGALAGLVNPADASINPWELLGFLAAPLTQAILDHQELLELAPAPGASGVLARLTGGTVHADRVLICTNAYAPLLLPSLAGLIAPRRGQMLAIRPDGPYILSFSYYANHGSEYFRQTPDGLIVVGGKRTHRASDEVGYAEHPTTAIQHEIERFARGPLGLSGPVVARWAGTMGFTPDGLPMVGPVDVPGIDHGAVWFCGGFTGHGMSLAVRTARAAVAHMLDGTPTPIPIDRFAGRNAPNAGAY